MRLIMEIEFSAFVMAGIFLFSFDHPIGGIVALGYAGLIVRASSKSNL